MKKRLFWIMALCLAIVIIMGLSVGCEVQPSTPDTSQLSESATGEVDSSDYIWNEESDTFEQKSPELQSGLSEYDIEILSAADFLVIYDTLEKLSKDAVLVVEGIVKSTSVHLHNVNDDTIPYTVYEVLVTKTLNGNTEIETIITVAEYGGVLTAAQAGLDKKFPEMTESEREERFFLSFGNEPVVVGQQLMLFLSDRPGYQILDIEQSYYMLIGEYFGRFIHHGDSYVQSLPYNVEGESDPVIIPDNLEILS